MLKKICQKQYVRSITYEFGDLKSNTKEEAKYHCFQLHREALRVLPHVKRLYHLTIPYMRMKNKIRKEFLKNKGIEDLDVIDNLIMSGMQEIQDAYDNHTSRGILTTYFSTEEDLTALPQANMEPFLQQFFTQTEEVTNQKK